MKIKRIKDQYVRQIQVVLIIYLVCCILRIAEYMILRTDQTFWGESFVHKLLGLVLLVPALRFYGLNFKQIGLGTKNLFRRVSLGLIWGSLFFALAYLVEIAVLLSQGNFLGLDFYVSAYSVNGNIGQQRGFLFLLICLAGNLINVLMEEGIFRGLFQKVFERKYSFIKAALFSSLLFGFWHIMAPFRSLLDGEMSLTGFWINSLILVLTSFLIGLQFALMAKMTGSLYM
ncbi:MAG: CPBP family intramembrane metalloprotease, partial [Streptococcus sanguinis]|nr:CPBP family intramembrane metalloprotease [Streptococcus sanguinis]